MWCTTGSTGDPQPGPWSTRMWPRSFLATSTFFLGLHGNSVSVIFFVCSSFVLRLSLLLTRVSCEEGRSKEVCLSGACVVSEFLVPFVVLKCVSTKKKVAKNLQPKAVHWRRCVTELRFSQSYSALATCGRFLSFTLYSGHSIQAGKFHKVSFQP